ncbi:HSP20-like chaperone [Astrocystis sublimbata]|nr:HSP20-like chaperone [Astrocystis sublimbata]
MSVFAHHPFYAQNNDFGNFGGLVRFIDDWDKHFSQKNGQDGRQTRRNVPSFTPRFDVRETEENYELHGELPGANKKDVHIDFTDVQTILIRGSVERSYSAGTPPAGLLGDASVAGAITNESHADDSSETRSNKSFQATVEDEKEGTETTTGPVVESSKPEAPTPEPAQQQKHKYWVYERSAGNFSRTFTFSNRVDHENVSASMDNGILTVIVPKAKKPAARRIAIN